MHKTEPRIKGIIKEYTQSLKNLGINTERVILYGSFAKGQERTDSDIDIIVISKDFQSMNLRERLEVLGVAAARMMRPIEAKGYTPEEIKAASHASFLREILEAGVSI
ncbi:MAG: nucleotidyltransferase domain-containing protein [Candidatus Omnitrophica bacterium]|nr:nucleotidyltransferase domain-containing protein [Candidatus Omnitrophota bacterium]MBU4589645.1 nucleotidyltransferase domain-containing protein [Candidatus Omnitrophota bacterium]